MKRFLLVCLPLIFTLGAISEPLWMRYPAISPDGSQIVFSYQDDLWLVNSNGGEAKAITRHEAHDMRPIWSNDGKSIAFASSRYGNYDVFLLDLATNSVKRLTNHSSDDYPCDFTNDDKNVLFNSVRVDDAMNAQFPYGRLGELYSISIDGEKLNQVISIAAEYAQMSNDNSFLIYQNKKGYEDEWRKHHTSSVTRDIAKYDFKTKSFSRLTNFKGEDRNPILSKDDKSFYYLSEESGTINIWYQNLDGTGKKQITTFKNHPIRFLTASSNGKMCFGYNGELFTIENNGTPKKVSISLVVDLKTNEEKFKEYTNGASEFAVSPNGKEVVFVIRGDVFVTSTEYGTTKTITSTPWQERSVSFSPDGKAILYAAEKGTSWSVYQTRLVNENESYFFNGTLIKEEVVIESPQECFQPKFSPDGSEVAFLEERTTLRVINLKSKEVRTILPGSYNYSYSDGDQWYSWSPDGKWFAVDFNDPNRWMGEVGLISSTGNGELVNLTQSGYGDGGAQWAAKGNVIIYSSDRYGMRSHGSWGAESDVMGVFLNQSSYDEYNKPLSELEEEKESYKREDDDDKDEKKNKKKEEEVSEIEIELDNIYDRKVRLSLHSTRLSGAILDEKARKLYYLSRYEKGTDLWEYDHKKRAAKSLVKFEAGASGLELSKDEKTAYVMSAGMIWKVELNNGQKKPIAFKAQLNTDYSAERAYLFEHMWRQAKKKFYKVDLHGVDWGFYKKEYARFLPHVNNNHDFAELMSELLGELNASHTGCRSYNRWKHSDNTAALGIYIDYNHKGQGVKIAEIMPKSPLISNEASIENGNIITAINGETIKSLPHYYALLNHKTGEKVMLEFLNTKGKSATQYVTPISRGGQYNLMYERWVEGRRELAMKLSNGKVGYVHVRGMDDASFRQVYEDLLGKHSSMEAVIVDTRFNSGGWLHDDLATLLSGEKYVDFVPRGQYVGSDPQQKWNKPSCVLAGEGNYSDAHAFPWVYQTLGIGPVIGMPVPGTMTAVWWETQIDNTIVFGIPQVGARDNNGNFLENTELQPDILVNNEPAELLKNNDTQIEKAVEYLLKEIKK